MRRSWWLVLLLVLCLVPRTAVAEEIDYLGSFGSGFDAFLGNGVNESVTPERDFEETYEPQYVPLRDGSESEGDSGEGNLAGITSVVDAWSSIPVGSGSFNQLSFLRLFFGAVGGLSIGATIVTTAIGLCFFWWGLRKSVRMVMGAFRKGRQNV